MNQVITIEIDGPEVSIHGTTKGDATEKSALQGTAFRWSRSVGAWILPRNLRVPTRNHNVRRFVAALEAAGRTVVIDDTGAHHSPTERRDARQERLEHRLERHQHVAAKSAAESASRHATVRQILDHIPMGQPILVGHHSERGHRRVLDKVDTNMRKSVEAQREAERAASLAAGLERRLASGDSLGTVRRRIDRLEAEKRGHERSLNGDSRMGRKPASPEYAEQLQVLIADLDEEIGLDKAAVEKMADNGVKVWTRDDFQVGDEVGCWMGWAKVTRVNAKSVSVKDPEYGWNRTLPYDKVKMRRRDGVVEK